jgi:hypothetical protein
MNPASLSIRHILVPHDFGETAQHPMLTVRGPAAEP